MHRAIIIGAGLAGLSAALQLAEMGIPSELISVQPSERAQSVLAEGGINAALNCMGEDDTPQQHAADTLRAGVWLADARAVQGLTEHAPEIIQWLCRLGVPFNREDGHILQRKFGGQKKMRTAFAQSSTGKIIMNALIDAVRAYEAQGVVRRWCHHEFLNLRISEGSCVGTVILDLFAQKTMRFTGPVIMATGGLNGFFPGRTTGTTANTGMAAAALFSQGVVMSNLEMIQYHPTTIAISGKRCLVTEAARGEGGRLFIEKGGSPYYFMEDRYPELGNLMPRDVVAREMSFMLRDPGCGDQVYLDMRSLTARQWHTRLADLREELKHYLNIDPATTPFPVSPGIHYFMGGIDVDISHRTNLPGLYAAGECCSQYHGANRLGGNSMLGAIYAGRVAAQTLSQEAFEQSAPSVECEMDAQAPDPKLVRQTGDILYGALGIIRSAEQLQGALLELDRLRTERRLSPREENHLMLAKAMLQSALLRRESRGAHYREDYPATDPDCARMIVATRGDDVHVAYR